MLVLSRKLGEEIVVGDHIRVKVLAIVGNRVRLGLTAPAGVPVRREEIVLASQRGGLADKPVPPEVQA
jgi:carbon storage regulator